MSVQITHVRLAGSVSGHEYITDVYWVEDGTAKAGPSSKAKMVEWIDNGLTAYVRNGLSPAIVRVVRPAGRLPYLRTIADGQWSDNLLSLPRF
jgi:hypothetical protein